MSGKFAAWLANGEDAPIDAGVEHILRSRSGSVALERVVRPVFKGFELVTADTLGRALFGENAGLVFYAASRNWPTCFFCTTVWICGACLSFSSIAGFVSPTIGYVGGLMTLPGLCLVTALFNIQILRELCRTFQVCFAFMNVVLFTVCFAFALGDERAGVAVLL